MIPYVLGVQMSTKSSCIGNNSLFDFSSNATIDIVVNGWDLEKCFSSATMVIVVANTPSKVSGESMSENRSGDEEFRRLLWFLLGGSRGGETG